MVHYLEKFDVGAMMNFKIRAEYHFNIIHNNAILEKLVSVFWFHVQKIKKNNKLNIFFLNF